MKRRVVDFYIGFFVLAGLVAVGVMILTFSGRSTQGRREVIVLFDDAGGLIKEAPVRHAGVACGVVRTIIGHGKKVKGKPDIPRDKVKVVLLVDDDVTLYKEDKVEITAVGLLGEMAVQIVPARGKRTPLPRGEVMEGINPLGLPEQVARLVGPVREVMENIKDLTSDQGPVVGAFEALERIAEESLPDMASHVQTAVTAVASETESLLREIRGQSGDLIASVDETVKSSSDFIDNLNRLTAEKGLLTGAVKDLRGLVEEYRRVAQDLHPVIQNIRAGKGGLGRFLSDETWYSNLSKFLAFVTEHGVPLNLHPEKTMERAKRLAERRPSEPVIWTR